MYMKAQQIVVELVTVYDSRHAPLTGVFPRLSSLLGLHHYSYQIPEISPSVREVRPDILAHDVQVFMNKIFFGTGSSFNSQKAKSNLDVQAELFHGGSIPKINKETEKLMEKYGADELGIEYGGR